MLKKHIIPATDPFLSHFKSFFSFFGCFRQRVKLKRQHYPAIKILLILQALFAYKNKVLTCFPIHNHLAATVFSSAPSICAALMRQSKSSWLTPTHILPFTIKHVPLNISFSSTSGKSAKLLLSGQRV